MKRNFLSICLICVMLFSLCFGITISAQAGPIELPMIPGNPSPSVPTGLKYAIANSQVTITSYTGSNTKLIIPDKIQNYPVTTIGDSAFQGCDKLTQIILPNTITSIGSNAFGWCEKLVSVNIPNGVTQIGNNAFNHCYSLSSISIPSSVVDIGSSLFYECDTLVGIWVDENNPSYSSDEYGVLFNKDKSILLRAPSAISGSYIIPSTVTTISEYAFQKCSSLINVTIPDSVIEIRHRAFNSCGGLQNISIPKSVTYVDEYTFEGCYNLLGIWVDGNNPNYSSDQSGVLFDKNKNTLIFAPCAMSKTYVIPSTVTYIYNYAFMNCVKLTQVTIPNSVTNIGEYAFAYCNGLNEIIFQGNAPALGDVCFRFVTATVYYPNDDSTWTDDVMKQYEGNITWIPMDDTVSGDIDGDMTVDNKDVEFLLWHTLFPEDYPLPQNADFNGDSAVDNQDVEYLLWHTLFPEDYPLS